MDEGFPDEQQQVEPVRDEVEACKLCVLYLTLEPLVCVRRSGPTPFHPEPGRETWQRRGYWGFGPGRLGPCTQTNERTPTGVFRWGFSFYQNIPPLKADLSPQMIPDNT